MSRIGVLAAISVKVLLCLCQYLPAELPPPATEPPADGQPVPGANAASEPVPEIGSESREADVEPPSLWLSVPPVRIFPRSGYFFIPPEGPGYYSVRDLLQHQYRDKPPVFAYPPFSLKAFSFFDADFRYLEKPDNQQRDWLDPLKRIHLGENWLFSTGGEARFRQMNEVDRQLTGLNNSFQLYRTRLYGDLWLRDRFRVFVEYIDARSFNEDFPTLTIDENENDLLNAFIDLKLVELAEKPAFVRVGRQELLLGSQRLLSPLEWANTRRTFEGVKVFRQGERFDADVFWVQPVAPDGPGFDSGDHDVNFTGIWTTCRRTRGRFLDLYVLNLDQARPVPTVGNVPGPYNVSTIGTRSAGDFKNRVLWDGECMYQAGRRVDQSISAAACTGALGYRFADVPMVPQFWVNYDWATGDQTPGAGAVYGTFNQLFPFSHYYFGYLDLVGRQNIRDASTQLVFYPARWLIGLVQYHHFNLDSARDALYNAGGVPIRRDPTGRAGTYVGDEIDVLANVHLSPHQDILVGYSKLFAGSFVKQTGNPESPELFYLQYQFRW